MIENLILIPASIIHIFSLLKSSIVCRTCPPFFSPKTQESPKDPDNAALYVLVSYINKVPESLVLDATLTKSMDEDDAYNNLEIASKWRNQPFHLTYI